MAEVKKIDALQSLTEAAGLAVACDFSDAEERQAERVPAHAAWAPASPNATAPARSTDSSWAQPKFQSGFKDADDGSPKHVLTMTFAQWLASRMPAIRHS